MLASFLLFDYNLYGMYFYLLSYLVAVLSYRLPGYGRPDYEGQGSPLHWDHSLLPRGLSLADVRPPYASRFPHSGRILPGFLPPRRAMFALLRHVCVPEIVPWLQNTGNCLSKYVRVWLGLTLDLSLIHI